VAIIDHLDTDGDIWALFGISHSGNIVKLTRQNAVQSRHCLKTELCMHMKKNISMRNHMFSAKTK
jgi:hypothetical protein